MLGAGQTLLMAASLAGCKEMVDLLLQKGPDLELENVNGETALSYACQRNHPEVVA